MSKDKSKRDISPGKKPGPLTKKERKERKKKRKEKHPKWLFLFLFTFSKNPELVFLKKKMLCTCSLREGNTIYWLAFTDKKLDVSPVD